MQFSAPGPGGFYGPPGGQPGYGGYGYPMPPPIRQVHSMAIVSLVSALLGWAICPVLGGLVALITGAMARKEIRSDPRRWDGDGLALAGMIVGGVHMGLLLLVGGLYLLMILGVMSAAILGA